ncbi:murein biosynthesis integral membrane protein MurJ [Microlunatus soli]|nr:murein biosynthesis integral membrane protein MurJ [Microlunatus soli]
MTRSTDATEAGPEKSGASRLISATAIMAAGTAASRVLGFAKAALLVVALGSGTRQADMFGLANVVPQAIYLLLAGGVLNTVFVPQIVRAMKEDDDGGEAFTNRLITLGMAAIGVIAVGATLLAPLIMRIYLDGEWLAPKLAGQFQSIIMLAYLCLPQIFFYGLTVMLGQVLNARGKFGPMMWAPVLNNVVGIASIGVFLVLWPSSDRDLGAPFTLQQELLLGLGATIGILAQALVLIPYLRAIGFRYRPRFDFRHSGLGRAGKVAKWTVGYMIVTQLALVVVSRLASGAVPKGGVGAGWVVYQNANLIFMLPHSLITVSLVTAMLPSTSRLVLAGRLGDARDEVVRTMRLAVTTLLPASVAFLALGFPIAQLLFGHGAGSKHWDFIGWTLVAFAIGLVPFTLQYICLRAFYALEDTRTTFFVQILIAGVNIGAALLLVLPIGKPAWVAPGLALAYSLAYIVGLGVSFHQLGKRLPGLRGGEIARHCVRVFLAVLPAGVAAYAITWGFAQWSTGFGARVLALAIAGLVALGLYFGLARVLHITEINQIVATVLRRGGRGSGSSAISSEPDGGSGPQGFASSGTIGDGADAAATLGSTDNANDDDGHHDDADSDQADEASIITQIRRRSDHPAGQQMTGGQSDQPHLAEAGAAVTPPPVTGPTDDLDAPDTEQTASFTLDELESGAPADPPGEQTEPVPDHLPAGTVLADRYRLEELLAWTGASITWRAFDQVLSRSVVIHLLPVGDDRSDELLAAGRHASGATDSRFLRVLDAVGEGAVTADGQAVGSYIVSEYAEGQSLQSVLTAAPLTGLESAWVVREVADALSGAHARGLHHRRLNPETVIITPAGNIKIVGLLIEAALRPEEYADAPSSDDALTDADVTDLGRLLYACLVARWPGEAAFGLPAAPSAPGGAQESGHPWLTPRQVRHGVSPTLDRICDQLLSPIPRQRAPRIVTAAELVGELDRVLGSADATGDLERRLRHPQPRILGEDPDTGRIPVGVVAEPYALVERNGSIAAGTNSASSPAAGTPASPDQPTTTIAAAEPDEPRPGPRRWIWLVVIAALIAAVVITVITAQGLGPAANLHPNDPKTSAAPPADRPIKIVDGKDFDPPPGNGEEHPGEVKNAYDGDPKTRWTTMSYFGSPDLGNLKPGVGIVLDLGSVQQVGSVKLQLYGNGTDVQIRVPKGEAGAEPDMNSLKSWRTVARQKDIGESGTCTLDEKVKARYVLVFLTSLPEEGDNYRGGINEVEVVS